MIIMIHDTRPITIWIDPHCLYHLWGGSICWRTRMHRRGRLRASSLAIVGRQSRLVRLV